MKTQVSFFVLLLLLVALVHEADCQIKTVRYKRTVKGRVRLGRSTTPAKNLEMDIVCTGTATYRAPAGYNVDRTISGSRSFKTNSKGQVNFSFTILDEGVEKGDTPKDFEVSCDINIGGDTKVVVNAKGKKDINFGTIFYFPDP